MARSVWNVEQRGAFVMSSHYDGHRFYWFGTEDKGVWRYDPHAPEKSAWRQFTTKDGLGDDNAYAIASDLQGRVWVGHQNHGVSVWNGRGWRNYGVLDGPLGERVFDIAVSPLTGEVWIAGNRGIARYDTQRNTWKYEGRISGLPSDQIQCLAFGKDGTVYIGTQCDGLVIGEAKDNYTHWDVQTGPGYMPIYATGPGLPSDLINDILVGKDGTVYVATGYGLARSTDEGESWVYLRGRDWKDKVNGQLHPPAIPQQPNRDTLLEDYVTSLAEDSGGNIWLGHPTKGVEVRSAGADFLGTGGVVQTPDEKKAQERQQKFDQQLQDAQDPEQNGDGNDGGNADPVPQPPQLGQDEKTDYVTSILPIPGEAPLVSGYGSGVVQLGGQLATFPREDEEEEVPTAASAVWPSPAPAPSVAQLKGLLARVTALQQTMKQPGAAVLDDDWDTKGDWVGHYGTKYALLCSMGAPLDHRVINDTNYKVEGRLGLHPYLQGKTYDQQGLRHWVHRTRWDDERVLYDPLIGYRRQADSDDNGESYPLSYEGPDIWMGVRIPAGTHRVSLYFFNKDGHDGSNRIRDYLIDVKMGHSNLVVADGYPTLARARVHDFWGGVYKSFLVQGPGDYYFVLRKNNSFNTIVQAVLVDRVAGEATEWDDRRDVWLGNVHYESPTSSELDSLAASVLKEVNADQKEHFLTALQVWQALDEGYDKVGAADLQGPLQVLAYRTVREVAGGTQPGKSLLAAWRWKLPVWSEDDRKTFDDTMQKGWDALIADNPRLISIKK